MLRDDWLTLIVVCVKRGVEGLACLLVLWGAVYLAVCVGMRTYMHAWAMVCVSCETYPYQKEVRTAHGAKEHYCC